MQRFERDPRGAEEEARDLAGVAGSLGVVLPKADVEGDGQLWIARFTSARDTEPVERVEVVTLELAAQFGMRAAVARLELRDGEIPIALIRRFDRRGATRIPYLSARTALGWQRDEGGYCIDMADVIRQISMRPVDDLHEPWRRIAFTIPVSNTGDQLKNHGFIFRPLEALCAMKVLPRMKWRYMPMPLFTPKQKWPLGSERDLAAGWRRSSFEQACQ